MLPKKTISLPFTPEDVRDGAARKQGVVGVGRVADNDCAVLVSLREPPTDQELRRLHAFLRDWPA